MIELTYDVIDTTRLLQAVSHEQCGAQVLFVGTTRRWTVQPQSESAAEDGSSPLHSLETDHLVYDSYKEMALAQMQRLADQTRERWPVKSIAMVHRLGRVDPREASVAVAVSCPHRSEAFEAASWLIDELKHEVPIWKQEHYVQSGPEWIHPSSGSCRCDASRAPSVEPVTRQNDPVH